MMANYIFSNYLSQKDKVLTLANSMLEAHIADKETKVDHTAVIERKQRELARLNQRLDNYTEMRADGEISREIFQRKTAELEPQIGKLIEEIRHWKQSRTNSPKSWIIGKS